MHTSLCINSLIFHIEQVVADMRTHGLLPQPQPGRMRQLVGRILDDIDLDWHFMDDHNMAVTFEPEIVQSAVTE